MPSSDVIEYFIHPFGAGITFEAVLNVYIADRQLHIAYPDNSGTIFQRNFFILSPIASATYRYHP